MVTPPLFQFGVIADIQYADTPDGTDFAKTTKRHYRGALEVLQRAVSYWNGDSLEFVANLGDAIDGHCRGLGQTERDLDSVLAEFARCRCARVVHLIGNHDLYNFASRDELDRLLQTRGGGTAEYYSWSPTPSFRVIVLDPYQISLLWPPGHPNREEARTLLRANNPNDVENSSHGWFDGVSGFDRRFVPYNGALGEPQLAWLRAELQAGVAAGQELLLLTHVPLHPEACDGTTMAWDYEAALAAIDEVSGSVVAVIAGHDHKGGYAIFRGVHHITLKSPLNLGSSGECYGRVALYADRIELRGPRLVDLVDARLLDGWERDAGSAPDDTVIQRVAHFRS